MKLKILYYICLVAAIAALYPSTAHAAPWTFTSVKTSFDGLPGAFGNGFTDDTLAINRAIAAGTAVYFPPGTYKYVGPMTLPTNKSFRLYGDGPGVSTILFFNSNAGITVTHSQIATLNVEGLTLMAGGSPPCGTAINASFAPNVNKFRTASIHNVQIMGSARDGLTGGYWTNGIRLFLGQNSVIDKVEISGNKNLTQTGIALEAPTEGNSTGYELSNIEVKWCNIGLSTNGWVEGLYMTGFEIVSCGRNGLPAVSLNGAGDSPGVFQLVNGLVDSFGSGVHMSNIILAKVSNVTFKHSGPEHSTMLSLSNVRPAVVSECSFYGTNTTGIFENGIFLANADAVQISGNRFANMQNAGSAIVVLQDSSVVRITDNLFSTVSSHYNVQAADTYYCGNYPTNNCGSTP